jgi:predicted ATP-binding protein involved in virulence
MDDRITIIHSPNGSGKTIILKMLDGLFNDRYSDLKTTSYKSFNVEFDDGQRIEIQKEVRVEERDNESHLIFQLHSQDKEKTFPDNISPTTLYIRFLCSI